MQSISPAAHAEPGLKCVYTASAPYSCRGPHTTTRDVGPIHGLVHGEVMSSPRSRLAAIAAFWTEEELEGGLDVLRAKVEPRACD